MSLFYQILIALAALDLAALCLVIGFYSIVGVLKGGLFK